MNDTTIDIIKELYEHFLPTLQKTDWNTLTSRYKQFLAHIPLSDYREKLQKIKTIEFDLSGQYRCFHLSLIYHIYWKKKFVKMINKNIPSRYKLLRNIYDSLINSNESIPLYQLLGKFGFNTEEQFVEWLYFKKFSGNISPLMFISIEKQTLSNNIAFPSFEDFWREYKKNIILDDFIRQHQSFIDIGTIKSQIIHEIRSNPDIFTLLREEDIKTRRTDELIKGYVLVGLKARIYRTWVSLLTQLDLSYTWNKIINNYKMDSDVILDLKGIDIYGKVGNSFVGIQIKKMSKRHEALKIIEGDTPIKTITVPYDLNFNDDKYLHDKLIKFSNGFVVFNDNYIQHIYRLLEVDRK